MPFEPWTTRRLLEFYRQQMADPAVTNKEALERTIKLYEERLKREEAKEAAARAAL